MHFLWYVDNLWPSFFVDFILMLGTLDGGLGYIMAVPEKVYRRLSMLQIKLTQGVRHLGGMNPKAYRFANPKALLLMLIFLFFFLERIVQSITFCIQPKETFLMVIFYGVTFILAQKNGLTLQSR